MKKKSNYEVVIIDPDKIRDTISSDKFDYQKEQIVRKRNLKEIKNALYKGKIAISDDLNYYTSMRHDLKKIAESLNLQFFIIYISTPVQTCVKWNESRGKPIPNELILKLNQKLNGFNKYNWDYPFAKFDLSKIKDLNNNIKELLEKIGIELKVLDRHNKKKIISDNKFKGENEMLDKITRKIVGEILQDPKYFAHKKKIIQNRKIYIKNNLNKPLNEPLIEKSFREFLEKSLN
ncbi:MAG: adenylyl-sulfate kinase [Candidatus Hermodarchaeota archaeon]